MTHLAEEQWLRLSDFGCQRGTQVVLQGLNLTLPGLGVTVLAGAEGGGAGELLRALSWQDRDKPDVQFRGQAWLAGEPLGAGNAPRLASQLLMSGTGTVRQQYQAWMPLRRVPAVGAAADPAPVLTRYGCHDLVRLLDEPVQALTPEQGRRLTIVAAAVCSPRLLLLDGPTDGMPAAAVLRVLSLMARIGKEQAVLVWLRPVEHARALGQRIVWLHQGQIGFDGPVSRFFAVDADAAVQAFLQGGARAAGGAAASAVRAGVPVPVPVPVSCPAPAPASRLTVLTPPAAKPEPLPEAALATERGAAATTAPAVPSVARAPAHEPGRVRTVVPEYRGPRGFRWIEPGGLGTCPAPGAVIDLSHDLVGLRTVGVTTLITLTEENLPQQALAEHGLCNVHSPIVDCKAPTMDQLAELVTEMSRRIAAGEVLAVHCRAGLGRTGTVVAGWLVHQGATVKQAMQRLHDIDRGYIQSAEQEWFLYKLESALRQSESPSRLVQSLGAAS